MTEPLRAAEAGDSGARGGAVTKRDQVAQALRDLIATGEIPRGSRIRQDEFAERFDVSITPIREAINLLHAEGLLVGEPRKGVRVAAVNPERLRSVYTVRRLMESYAMQRASRRMSPMDFRRAEELATKMERAFEQGDHTLVGSLNRDFHFTFYENCGVPGLLEEIDALWQNYPWDIMNVIPDRTPDALHQHRQILEAMVDGDTDRIETLTGDHLWGSYRKLIEHVTGHLPDGDPFDIEVPEPGV